MIRNLLFLVLILGMSMSCSSEPKKERPNRHLEEEIADGDLYSEDRHGNFTEYYPGKKQVKRKGRHDAEGNRIGIWKTYDKNGVELSIEMYKNGEKDGFTIVRYKNGATRYTGNYENGEKVGVWEFFDEQGSLVETKNFDEE